MSEVLSKLFDTTLPANYSKVLFEEKNLDLAPEHLVKMFDTVFTGSANLLNHAKSLNAPTALIFRDLKQNVVAVSVVQFFPNEDASKPGNWSLIWSFDEKDIPENALKIEFSDPQSHTYFRAVAGEKYGMGFKNVDCLVNCIICSFEQLKKWLDENAAEDKTIGIECDGLFKARVAIESNEKVFALEADGEIKNLIKDDAAIEK